MPTANWPGASKAIADPKTAWCARGRAGAVRTLCGTYADPMLTPPLLGVPVAVLPPCAARSVLFIINTRYRYRTALDLPILRRTCAQAPRVDRWDTRARLLSTMGCCKSKPKYAPLAQDANTEDDHLLGSSPRRPGLLQHTS